MIFCICNLVSLKGKTRSYRKKPGCAHIYERNSMDLRVQILTANQILRF